MPDPAGLERRVVWSRDALDDIIAQVIFIAKDNPAAARGIAAKLRVAGERLAILPSGRKGRMTGTYEKVVGRRPTSSPMRSAATAIGRDSVTILRVIHGSRNWQSGSWPDRSALGQDH